MRIGQNPAKFGLKSYQPQELGILLITYIPFQSDYFVDSLKIFEYQIASLHANTPTDFDIYVFDNGSCPEVQDSLFNLCQQGLIDWLVISGHNLGKGGALNWMLRGMPNRIICYADGDVYFRKGWYEVSRSILETFPNVGMVTAQPCFFDTLHGKGKAHHFLLNHPEYQISKRMAPQEIIEEYVRSIGNSSELHERYKHHEWQVIRKNNHSIEAIIGASPFQFVGYKSFLEKILPLPSGHGLNAEDDRQITVKMDEIGLLQLSTTKPYVYHMGNRLDEITLREIEQDHLYVVLKNSVNGARHHREDHAVKKTKSYLFKLLSILERLPVARRVFRRFYSLLFEYYASRKG